MFLKSVLVRFWFWLCLLFMGVSMRLPVVAQAPENLSVLSYWRYYNGQPTALYQYLCQQAFGQLAARKKTIQPLKTRQDWQKRQTLVQQKLKEAIGAFPEKTPLNPVVTGKVERDGITVEKLYFESMPNYYVTAALFLPAGQREKLPAILFCSGHNPGGFRIRSYQQMILNYVNKGFAVLAFDPIGQGERVHVTKADGTIRQSAPHQHSYPGAQSFVAGTSPALYFIWDGIRAIDYLLTRPEIDASRIGITGRSGGGTQTAYIAALDNRILAAAPEAYLTSFDKLLRSNGPQDAEQNLMGFIANGLDMADFVEVRAPKPTLMVTTTRDMFSIEGARETFQEAQTAYKALGAEASLTMVEDDAEHASTKKNREATYAFFQKYLQNPGSPTDEAITPFGDQELWATPTGNVYTSIKGETFFSLIKKRVPAEPKQPLVAQALQKQVIALTGYKTPQLSEVIFSGKHPRQGYDIEKYLINGPGSYYLPILWLKPQSRTNRVALYLHDKGKSEALRSQVIEQMVRMGYDVVLPDLSGAGELSKTYIPGGDVTIDSTSLNIWFAGVLTHKSLVSVRMEEIQLLADFIKKTVGSAPITAVGSGTFTADLLHTAVTANTFDRIALLNSLASYRSLTEQQHYKTSFIPSVVAGALAVYDLPDLVAMLSARQVFIAGLVDATGKLINTDESARMYGTAQRILTPNRLQLKPDAPTEEQERLLVEWLK